MLEALLRADGAVVTPEQLLEPVWDATRPVHQHRPHDGHEAAAQARRPAVVQTVRGAGYRL